MRLLPHDQDTGGFFVAVFRKKSSTIPDSTTDMPPVADSAPINTAAKPKKTPAIQNLQIIKSKSVKLQIHAKSESIFNPSAKSASNHALKSLGYNPKTLLDTAYKAKPSGEHSLIGVFGEYSFISKSASPGLWSSACENSWVDSLKVSESSGDSDDPSKLSLVILLSVCTYVYMYVFVWNCSRIISYYLLSLWMQLLFNPRSPVSAPSDEKKAMAKTAAEPVKKKRKYAGIFDSKVRIPEHVLDVCIVYDLMNVYGVCYVYMYECMYVLIVELCAGEGMEVGRFRP